MELPQNQHFDADPNPMPEGMARIDLAVARDVLAGAVGAVARGVKFALSMPKEFASHGDHTFDKRGAAEMLDTQLYDSPEIPANIDLGLE